MHALLNAPWQRVKAVTHTNVLPQRFVSVISSVACLSGMLLISTESAASEWHNRWQQEWTVSEQGSQKFESLFNFEWSHSIGNAVDVTAITRLTLDTEDHLNADIRKPQNYGSASAPWYRNDHGALELRELYIDATWLNSYWRIGKQQVVWGQADGLKVLDVVTPQSFREFILDDFDESRIPLWIVNAEIPLTSDSNLQWLWIPDATYHELAPSGSDYEITSNLRIPSPPNNPTVANNTVTSVTINEAQRPDNGLLDSDTGLRYSVFWQGWDITANYLYHYRDFAVLYQTSSNQGVAITPRYERSHLIGTTASNAFGDFTLRTEIGWFSHSYHIASPSPSNNGITESTELSWVLGLDWQGLSDTFISGQWFQSFLPSYKQGTFRDKTENTVSLLAERTFLNETWTLRLQAIASINREDYLWRTKLTHLAQSNLEVWLGADIFGGDDNGLYGQFDEQDRIVMGLEIGF